MEDAVSKSYQDIQNVNTLLMENNEQLRDELMEREENEKKLMSKVGVGVLY